MDLPVRYSHGISTFLRIFNSALQLGPPVGIAAVISTQTLIDGGEVYSAFTPLPATKAERTDAYWVRATTYRFVFAAASSGIGGPTNIMPKYAIEYERKCSQQTAS